MPDDTKATHRDQRTQTHMEGEQMHVDPMLNAQGNAGQPDGGNPGNADGPRRRLGSVMAGVGIASGVTAAAPTVAMAGLGAAGFTSAGIAGGSWAAGTMSSIAAANGLGVASGKICRQILPVYILLICNSSTLT
jgi:hypothetical protein